MMRKLLLAILLLWTMLSGCVGSLSTKKYVIGNAYVSESMPTVEIQVSSAYTLINSGDKTRDLVSDSPGVDQAFGVNVHSAKFINEGDRTVYLKIKTEYTTRQGWALGGANFKKWEGEKIHIGEQTINGKRFDTALIQRLTSRDILLTKVYSALYGSQCKMTIFITKRLRKRMFDSQPFSDEANKLLVEFVKVADKSFQLKNFDTSKQKT